MLGDNFCPSWTLSDHVSVVVVVLTETSLTVTSEPSTLTVKSLGSTIESRCSASSYTSVNSLAFTATNDSPGAVTSTGVSLVTARSVKLATSLRDASANGL